MFVDPEIKLARPIEEVSIISETCAIVLNKYLRSENFVTADHYPSMVELLDGEMGYLAIILGKTIFPVVRVVAKN